MQNNQVTDILKPARHKEYNNDGSVAHFRIKADLS